MPQIAPPPHVRRRHDAVPDTLDMSLLARRFQEVRRGGGPADGDLLTAAKNWRTGRCEQRTVCVLDGGSAAWARRGGVGTYGAVASPSRERVVEWASEAEEAMDRDDDDDDDDPTSTRRSTRSSTARSTSRRRALLDEVTAIDFDGERVGSGDASGGCGRTRERGSRRSTTRR